MPPALQRHSPRLRSLGAPLRYFRHERRGGLRLSQLAITVAAVGFALLAALHILLNIPKRPSHLGIACTMLLVGALVAYYAGRPLVALARGLSPTVVVTREEVLWGWAPNLAGIRLVEGLDLPRWRRKGRATLTDLRCIRYRHEMDWVRLEFQQHKSVSLPRVNNDGKGIAELLHALAPHARLLVDDRPDLNWLDAFRDQKAASLGILRASTNTPRRKLMLDERSLKLSTTRFDRWLRQTLSAFLIVVFATPLFATVYAGVAERNYFLLWLSVVLSGAVLEIARALRTDESTRSDLLFSFGDNELRAVSPSESSTARGEAVVLSSLHAILCVKTRSNDSDTNHPLTYELYAMQVDGGAISLSASATELNEVTKDGRALAEWLHLPFWEFPEPGPSAPSEG